MTDSDLGSKETYLVSDQLDSKIQQIKGLMSPLLENIHRGIPEYVDHGIIHSKNIISLLNSIFERFNFSESEKYLLYLSAWLHDLGSIIGNNHVDKSIKILELHRPLLEQFIDSRTINLLEIITAAHDYNFDIDKIKKIESHLYEEDTRLRFISALFRVIDSCDLQRVKRILYETLISFDALPPWSIVHWKAHLTVDSVQFEFENKAIVINVVDKTKIEVLEKDINADLQSVVHIFEDHLFPIKKVEVRHYGIVDS